MMVLHKDCTFLLQSSGGDSGPDMSFDKSVSPERLFSLACASLAGVLWLVFPVVASFLTFLASSGPLSTTSTKGLAFTPTDTSRLRNSNLMDVSPISASAFGIKGYSA
ncbi:hypothetical protein Tco_1547129 [Tanacetum coccineum]